MDTALVLKHTHYFVQQVSNQFGASMEITVCCYNSAYGKPLATCVAARETHL